jgi:CheY-like chemotaxis protein
MSATILLVEDTPDFRFLASIYLEGAGYKVVICENGLEALIYLQSHDPPAAIVLDLSMPVMSGPEFLEIHNHNETLMKIPVVLYSNEFTDSRKYGCPWNATAMVSKFANRDTFLDLVRYAANP